MSGENVAGRGGSRRRNILVRCRKSQRLEPEGISEQLIRGLMGHGKDSGLRPEMLCPGKTDMPQLRFELALAAVWRIDWSGQQQEQGDQRGGPCKRPGGRWEVTDQGPKWPGLGQM